MTRRDSHATKDAATDQFVEDFRVQLKELVHTMMEAGAVPQQARDAGLLGIDTVCDLALKGLSASRGPNDGSCPNCELRLRCPSCDYPVRSATGESR